MAYTITTTVHLSETIYHLWRYFTEITEFHDDDDAQLHKDVHQHLVIIEY